LNPSNSTVLTAFLLLGHDRSRIVAPGNHQKRPRIFPEGPPVRFFSRPETSFLLLPSAPKNLQRQQFRRSGGVMEE
jgi:hypothetical protein